jgi:hypothetical protein
MAEPRKDEQDEQNKNPPPGSQPNYPQPGQGGFQPGQNNPQNQPDQDQRQGGKEQRQGGKEQHQGGQNQSDKRDR